MGKSPPGWGKVGCKAINAEKHLPWVEQIFIELLPYGRCCGRCEDTTVTHSSLSFICQRSLSLPFSVYSKSFLLGAHYFILYWSSFMKHFHKTLCSVAFWEVSSTSQAQQGMILKDLSISSPEQQWPFLGKPSVVSWILYKGWCAREPLAYQSHWFLHKNENVSLHSHFVLLA